MKFGLFGPPKTPDSQKVQVAISWAIKHSNNTITFSPFFDSFPHGTFYYFQNKNLYDS